MTRGADVVTRVRLSDKFDLFHSHWEPKIVGQVNDMHVKLAKLEGEFVWHAHEHEDELFLVVATPWSERIITMVYHVISNVIDHDMSLADAVAAPRMHHQALPDQIRYERGGFLDGTLTTLERMGHELGARATWGDTEEIMRTPDGWRGVSDPRLGGGGAGY